MTRLKPNALMPQWDQQMAIDRIFNCRVMLSMHGFLTDAETERIHMRIVKWIEKSKHDAKK